MNGILFAAIPSPSPTSTPSGNAGIATWLTPGISIIVSLVTAFGVRGLLTTMLASRQQRIKDLREAWLQASDCFVTAASRSLAALQDLEPRQDTQGKVRRFIFGSRPGLAEEYEIPLREGRLEVARTAAVEAIEKLRRVQILSGQRLLRRAGLQSL